MNRNTPEEFDAIWEREKDNPEQFDRDKAFFQKIVDRLDDAKSVVDAGCGVGVILRKLNAPVKTGIDFSSVAVSALPGDIEGVVADLRNLPSIPRHEYVICTETLEHFEDDDLAVVLLGLSKLGKKFIFSVPTNFPDPFHVREFTRENIVEWMNMISDSYDIEEVMENGYHYLIIYGTFRNDL